MDNKTNKNEEYLTSRIDRVFKDIFLDNNDKSLLKGLLESILKIKIKKIVIQNTELNEGNKNLRRKVLDAILDTNQGIMIIELNTSHEKYIKVRNYAFLSKAFANHTLRGNKYDIHSHFIEINFTYGIGESDNAYFRKYKIQDEEGICFINNIEVYEFNMDKYRDLWYTNDTDKIKENKYLVMMDLPKEELEKFSKKDKVVETYMDKLNRINEDPTYQIFLDYETDMNMIINSEKDLAREKGREEGIKEGREKGIKEGHAEGKAEGIAEGLAEGERLKNIENAKKMLEKGISIEDISDITNLSKEEIEKLK